MSIETYILYDAMLTTVDSDNILSRLKVIILLRSESQWLSRSLKKIDSYKEYVKWRKEKF